MRIALSALVLVAGCDEVYGLPERPTDGAMGVDTPTCTAFGDFDRNTLFALSPTNDFDPQISSDGLELYTSGRVELDIMRATRPSPNELFGVGESLPVGIVSSPDEDADPALTADGLDLLFVSRRMPQTFAHTVWETRRANLGAEWGLAQRVLAIDVEARGIDLSPDGLTLYVIDGDLPTSMLYRYDRVAVGGVFTSKTLVGTGTRFPSVSPDGTEVYYTGMIALPDTMGIFRMTKGSNGLFSETPEPIVADAGDADISPDGSSLTFATSGGGVVQIKRGCVDQ